MAGVAASPPAPRLSLAETLLYASGSLASNLLFQSLAAWLFFLYAPPSDSGRARLVPIGIVGGVLLVGRLAEAVYDPLIGHWSDVTHTRWGRRIPFIVAGAPVAAALFFLLWAPPFWRPHALNAVYLLVVLEAFFLTNTIVAGPYEALLPEVAETQRERVGLSAWKVLFGAIGAAIGLPVAGVIIGDGAQANFLRFGVLGALLALAFRYLPVLGVRRHVRTGGPPRSRAPLPQAIRSTVANDQFLAYAPSFALLNAGQVMFVQFVPFFMDVILRDVSFHIPVIDRDVASTGSRVTLMTALFFLPLLASVPLMARASRRFGAARTYAGSMTLVVLYLPLLYFAGFLPGVPKQAQALLLIGLGIPFAALAVFPNPLLADVIDYDSRRTGLRREGVYYGVQGALERVGLAAAAGVFALLLAVFGDTAEDSLGIRLVGPVAAAMVLAGLIVFVRYYRLSGRQPAGDSIRQDPRSARRRRSGWS